MEAYIVKDRADWESHLDGISCDVYDHYDYVKLNCVVGEVPELFVAKSPDGMLIYPYIRRTIDDEYDDLVTAYGYGGPFRVGSFSDRDVEAARRVFVSHPANEATVSETIRYHPTRVDPVIMAVFGRAVPIRKTVHVRLDRPFEELQSNYHKMTRRNVRRAIREDVTIKRGDVADLETFMQLYEATMDRRGANELYYFTKHYYRDLLTSTAFETELLFACHEGKVIAGVLMLFGDEGAHYHLGGSYKEALPLRPNHLLFSEMVNYSLEKGKTYLHLGGGATGDDALYDFKQSFSGEPPLTFWIGQSVLNEDVYEHLNARHVQQYGISDYFPMYRTPVSKEEEMAQAD